MAGSINNNLYPPIIATAMPAFVRTSTCRVYFSISNYNSFENVKYNAQVVVTYQNSNTSALNENAYPMDVLITTIQVDNEKQGDDKYYIEIAKTDMVGGEFELNTYYKVQIRFTDYTKVTITPSAATISKWLTENQSYFSEWSTVCLIRGIDQPTFQLKGFDGNEEVVFTTEVTSFVGQMLFENSNQEKEYLKSYTIKLYDDSADELLYPEELVYTNIYNPNEINYTLPYMLNDGTTYRAEITYVTNNEYTETASYVFSIVQAGVDTLDATISATTDPDNGRICVNVVSTTSAVFMGNITIRRADSNTGFQVWRDIKTATINEGAALDYTWYDYTAESGVWYKYAVQNRDGNGNRGTSIILNKPVMIELDSIFLVNNDMQLNIKFDATISSFKKTLSETKTDTIGSQFPHFRRNAVIGYRQFPLSGLITAFCDEDGVFLSKDVIYGDMREYYDNYNDSRTVQSISGDTVITQPIDEYHDFIYEREFRERVMDFLYDNKAKLFRSGPEGNILVKIMDVSFTPNEVLGRMIYSFSATAYEIDECTQDNYEAYEIQTVGTYSPVLSYTFLKVGQLSSQEFTGMDSSAGGADIISLIQKKYSTLISDGYKTTINTLPWVRIEFESDPYLIKSTSGGGLSILSDSDTPDENTVYGYIVQINGNEILVSKRGIYELLDGNVTISTISFPVDTVATINYVAEIEQTKNSSALVSKITYDTKPGQVMGIFEPNTSVYQQIRAKYTENYNAWYKRMTALGALAIEAVPGTIIYLKDSFDDNYYRHIMNASGYLQLYDEDTTFSGLYFGGVHLIKSTADRLEARDDEYVETGISATITDEVSELIKNGVYTINGTSMIYYNGQWYDFDISTGDIACPIEAIVNYVYELIKGEYSNAA